jgi:predicted adenine nucleotide alpha hydrolase (AANH) superfamily ATPase
MHGGRDVAADKPPILLHSCCGPCSSAVAERLARLYSVTIFFYNPNVSYKDEYERRRDAQIKFIDRFNMGQGADGRIAYMEGPFEPEVFERAARGMEGEPEGGARCRACFRLRLEKTAEAAAMTGYDTFATTLGVSPRKDFNAIAKIGNELALRYGARFLAEDFKKQNGYGRSVELSKKYGLYRQSYCGCRFALERQLEAAAAKAAAGKLEP